jgi:hypothetical protein
MVTMKTLNKLCRAALDLAEELYNEARHEGERVSDCVYVRGLTDVDICRIDECLYGAGINCAFVNLPKVNTKRVYALVITAESYYGEQPRMTWSLSRMTD